MNNFTGLTIKKSYEFLYGNECPYYCELKFSSRFHDYGATISLVPVGFVGLNNVNNTQKNKKIVFRASRAWTEKIDEDIFIGLVQHLLLKLFGNPFGKTIDEYYLNLYDSFIHNIDKQDFNSFSDEFNSGFNPKKKKNKNEPLLVESFKKLNENYFFGMMDIPNIQFGREGKSQMGKFDFRTNTITINGIFRKPFYFQHFKRVNGEEDFLFADKFDIQLIVDAIMYHEMLHKKLKFVSNNLSGSNGLGGRKRRLRYHTTEFRQMEKQFENWKEAEKQMHAFIRWTRTPTFKLWLKNPNDSRVNRKKAKAKNFNMPESFKDSIKRMIFGLEK